MEPPKYYLEPYQVFILKKLLLQSSADKGIDKGILKIYSYRDYQYYEDTGSIKILRYLFRLSENKIFSIEEPLVSSIFGDAFLRLADNLITWIAEERIAEERIEKAQAILDRINTTKNHAVTMEEFGFLNKYIVTNEPPGELALVYCLNEGKEVFSRDVRLIFEVEFNEKGTEILRKYLDDYTAAFVNGALVSRKKENYFSYQTSADIFKEKFSRLRKLTGTDALYIKEEFFYRDKADYLEHVSKEMAPSSKNENLDQIRRWETLIAMEKEGYLKIIDIYPKSIFPKDPPMIRVQWRKESQPEKDSKTHDFSKSSGVKLEDTKIDFPKLSGRFKTRGKMKVFEFKYGTRSWIHEDGIAMIAKALWNARRIEGVNKKPIGRPGKWLSYLELAFSAKHLKKGKKEELENLGLSDAKKTKPGNKADIYVRDKRIIIEGTLQEEIKTENIRLREKEGVSIEEDYILARIKRESNSYMLILTKR